LHRGEDVLHAVVQLVDQHLRVDFLILVPGEIHVRGKILDNVTALVANRANEEASPEFAAILAAVKDIDAVTRTAAKLGLNKRPRLRIGGVRHQEIEALAEHLFLGVSGQGKKALIGENDRIFGCTGVGEDHRHAGRLGRDDERPAVVLARLDLGDGLLLVV
jgi:predicted acyltransferase (DUF342 family)